MSQERDGLSTDLSTLSPQEFEGVVGALLARAGFQIVRRAERATRGPDFEVAGPSGERVYVEVKHYRQPFPRAVVREIASDIARYRFQFPAARGLIVISGTISPQALQEIEAHPELEVWTGEDVRTQLAAHPDIMLAARDSTSAQDALRALAMLTSKPAPAPESFAYIQRIGSIAAGRDDWRAFEVWCADILTDIFKPDLGPPDRQNRTDDGLDIMDAIFPIRTGNPPWSQVRAEFATRFVVGEFKNFVDPIGQKQVESIAQYLWVGAKRQFGILVSRASPSAPALAQRRRAWIDQQKMIVFVTDQELIEMLQVREAGGEPYETLDAQVEEFLRTLTP